MIHENKPYLCGICNKGFAHDFSAMDHVKHKHGSGPVFHAEVVDVVVSDARTHDDDKSMAELMIEAEMAFASGLPVENDWLLDAL